MKLPADPVVRELLPEFIDDWLVQLDTQFAQTLANRDGEDLYRLGHTLKGSCFQFELNDIAKMGIELMGMAERKQWEQAGAQIDAIRQSFRVAKEYLQGMDANSGEMEQ